VSQFGFCRWQKASTASAAPAFSQSGCNINTRVNATPEEITGRLCTRFGEKQGRHFGQQLEEAGTLFGSDRYEEARKLIEPIARQAPEIAEVRELYGLVLYREHEWLPAAKELEAFNQIAETTEQHPVLMDCYRAQKNWTQVAKLWKELQDSPSNQSILTEGVMVVAGGLADRGKLVEAIKLLEGHFQELWGHNPPSGTPKIPKRTAKKLRAQKPRVLYQLADLYDRVGDAPQAVAVFHKIEKLTPNFLDVRHRLKELGSGI